MTRQPGKRAGFGATFRHDAIPYLSQGPPAPPSAINLGGLNSFEGIEKELPGMGVACRPQWRLHGQDHAVDAPQAPLCTDDLPS